MATLQGNATQGTGAAGGHERASDNMNIQIAYPSGSNSISIGRSTKYGCSGVSATLESQRLLI